MNRSWRYILVLSLLMAACDAPYMPEISNVPEDGAAVSRTDAEGRDARVYHQNSLDTIGPGKDGAFWMNDQEVSVSTDFPAPSWFRQMKKCKTPGAHFHIGIGPQLVICKVDIPFELDLTKDDALSLENKIHDALEGVLQEYWNQEEEVEISFNETFEELLEKRLREQRNGSA